MIELDQSGILTPGTITYSYLRARQDLAQANPNHTDAFNAHLAVLKDRQLISDPDDRQYIERVGVEGLRNIASRMTNVGEAHHAYQQIFEIFDEMSDKRAGADGKLITLSRMEENVFAKYPDLATSLRCYGDIINLTFRLDANDISGDRRRNVCVNRLFQRTKSQTVGEEQVDSFAQIFNLTDTLQNPIEREMYQRGVLSELLTRAELCALPTLSLSYLETALALSHRHPNQAQSATFGDWALRSLMNLSEANLDTVVSARAVEICAEEELRKVSKLSLHGSYVIRALQVSSAEACQRLSGESGRQSPNATSQFISQPGEQSADSMSEGPLPAVFRWRRLPPQNRK